MATMPQSMGPTQPVSDPSSNPPLSWEGDKMFNIYIYDYCNKRGFRQTAQHLMTEADIPLDAKPPINARQGLLFEWWSVFWVLFTAKASGTGSEEALLYVNHQVQQQASRQRPQAPPQPGIPNSVPPQRPPMNGMPQQNRPPFIPNGGTMSNGIVPQGNPASFPNPQMNGGALTAAVVTGGQPNFAGQMMQNQRPPMPPGPAGQQPRNFASPTIDPATNGGQQQTPQMRGGMMPPGAPGFQQMGGRPPSRSGTPGSQQQQQQQAPGGGMMPHPSPGLANRQPSGMMPGPSLDAEVMKIPQNMLIGLKQEVGLDMKDMNALNIEEKQRLLKQFHVRTGQQKPGARPPNAPTGPSGVGQPMQGPARNAQQQQQQQPRGQKRNSTSPQEEAEGAGSSPPGSKRPKPSPMDQQQQQQPMAPMTYPGQQPPQQPQSQPSPMNNGMMRSGPMSGPQQGGFPGMQPMMGAMAINMGGPGSMPPQMGGQPGMPPGQPGPGGMMTPQMQARDPPYRQALHAMHGRGMPQQPQMPGNAGSPPADGGFNPGGPPPPGQFPPGPPPPGSAGGRMPPGPPGGPQKPMNMLPPPSPKDGPPKVDGIVKSETSPQQRSGQTPGGTAPATPAPPPTASPSALLAGGQPQQQQQQPPVPPPPPPSSLDSFDVMGSFAGLEDFDPSFRVDDINFERDFGQWFNPNDAEDPMAGLK